MRQLILYNDYSREEVHDIFDQKSTFTPQAGTWGQHGFVELPDRPRDYVFFVTFGQKQANHRFNEGITADGVFRWQSQPRQRLADPIIKQFIAHDDDQNSIYVEHSQVESFPGISEKICNSVEKMLTVGHRLAARIEISNSQLALDVGGNKFPRGMPLETMLH